MATCELSKCNESDMMTMSNAGLAFLGRRLLKTFEGIGSEEEKIDVDKSGTCQRTLRILNSSCETSDPHSYSAHSILQRSPRSPRWRLLRPWGEAVLSAASLSRRFPRACS